MIHHTVTHRVEPILTAFLLIALLAPHAPASSEEVFVQTAGDSDSEWSEEDFQSSQAVPMGTASALFAEEIVPTQDIDNRSTKGHAAHQGDSKTAKSSLIATSMPTSTIPLPNATADRTDPEIAPAQAGTSKAPFSSQRLVPRKAALSWPYRTVGRLFFKDQANQSFVCSASIIAFRLILTAGHCVHNGNGQQSGWFNSFTFVPAYGARGNGDAPWGRWTWARGIVSNAWANGGGALPNPADYAILELRNKRVNGKVWRIGALLGHLGWQTNSLAPNHAHILGYPVNLDGGLQMHQVTAQSFLSFANNNIGYGSDMRGGASGGPFIQNFGKSPKTAIASTTNARRNRVVGVTSFGSTSLEPQYLGSSTLSDTFVAMWQSMCRANRKNCRK